MLVLKLLPMQVSRRLPGKSFFFLSPEAVDSSSRSHSVAQESDIVSITQSLSYNAKQKRLWLRDSLWAESALRSLCNYFVAR